MRITRLTAAVAVLASVTMGVAACGDDEGTSASGGKCDLVLAFFGAQTGDAANLGINISNGAKLAIDQYNAKNPDCKVTFETRDSQGDPTQAKPLALKVAAEKKIVGVIGPAFSGESNNANPVFEEAGLPIITPSATNPLLATKGWKIFHRILGNDAVQGPAAAKYIAEVLKADKVFVVDDASDYGKGLAAAVKDALGTAVVGTQTVQQKQTDFSAVVSGIKASGATVLFYGGYYAEAGLLRKQLTDGGGQAITMVAGDGVKDDGFVSAAGSAAAEGSIVTCPCLPPDKAGGTFFDDFKKAYNVEPGTYSAEAFDAATVFLDGIAAGKTTRADMLAFIKSYNKQGLTKMISFDDKGEVADKGVWAYKVSGGKIVADQEIK